MPFLSVFRKPIYLIAIAGSLVYLPASASTIANTFLPGQTYSVDGGYLVGGFVENEVAAAFTPSENYSVTQIDVAITFVGGFAPPPGFVAPLTLTLNEDSGGIPGAVMETWNTLESAPIPTTFGGPAAPLTSDVVTVHSVEVPLLAGVQYWIAASTPFTGDPLFWWTNAPAGNGATGGIEYISQVCCGPALSFYHSDTDLAFEVLGDPTPEPGGFCLLGVGLLGLSLPKLAGRWKSSRRQHP
jgi:hypothetical protein